MMKSDIKMSISWKWGDLTQKCQYLENYEIWPKNVNILKVRRSDPKMWNDDIYRCWYICYRMVRLRMLYSVTLTFILKANNLNVIMILQTVRANATNLKKIFIEFGICLIIICSCYVIDIKLRKDSRRHSSPLADSVRINRLLATWLANGGLIYRI